MFLSVGQLKIRDINFQEFIVYSLKLLQFLFIGALNEGFMIPLSFLLRKLAVFTIAAVFFTNFALAQEANSQPLPDPVDAQIAAPAIKTSPWADLIGPPRLGRRVKPADGGKWGSSLKPLGHLFTSGYGNRPPSGPYCGHDDLDKSSGQRGPEGHRELGK